MGIDCIGEANLKRLTEVSRFVYEIANVHPNRYQPYVGISAFAHKGGVHAAVRKSVIPGPTSTCRPSRSATCGNFRSLTSPARAASSSRPRNWGLEPAAHDLDVQLALEKIRDMDLKMPPKSAEALQTILERVKDLEAEGYQFESAEASLEMLLRAALGQYREYFRLLTYRVVDQKVGEEEQPLPEATLRVRVGPHEVHTAAMGNGPVNALFKALLKALVRFYPRLAEMRLEDFKVRVLPGTGSTDAKVRVLIESRDANDRWGTVGVSHDIIEASWAALVDGISYKLLKDEAQAR